MDAPRVLIADDQPHVLEALQLLLKNEGFATEVVNSPEAVLIAIQDRAFDLLLLDMNYARDTTSGDEGLQLLSRIRELDRALPVIFMTAWGTIDLAVTAMQDGSGDFVQKPWDNEKLLASLRKQLEVGRVMREKQNEVTDAREIQRRLLPVEMPRIEGCDIHAFWKPAKDVGGDYFDAIRLADSSVALCIADVAGKGMPAALLMSNLQASVRSLAQTSGRPAQICRELNRVALENTRSNRFTTLFYGVLDSNRRSFRYANAGHVPPILVRGNGEMVRLSEGGVVLGVFPDAEYEDNEVRIDPGDLVVLVTDGITEATNTHDEDFGEDRLLDFVSKNRNLQAKDLQRALLDSVTEFAGQPLQDDATLMVVSMGRRI